MGTILFKGEFNPQSDPSAPEKGLHQTFPVQVPPFSEQGDNILSLTHLQMVGVSISTMSRCCDTHLHFCLS